MSNLSGEGESFSSENTGEEVQQQKYQQNSSIFHGSNSGPSSTTTATTNSNGSTSQQQPVKKKRNLPGTPDPTAEVIALSPTTLMATNRFVCEICNKGFQRDQNLQLHRRGHNLPWKLKQRTTTEIRKRVYICPETTCVHHNPSRALGDLTGIKKHFCRKHGEKKWKCDKCSKKYAVQSDWKAHSKTCGTREYKCDCGTIFSRRDSFITHRAFCDALAEENNKVNQGLTTDIEGNLQGHVSEFISTMPLSNQINPSIGMSDFSHDSKNPLKSISGHDLVPMSLKSLKMTGGMFSTTSGALFGPRSLSSTSSCLQLSGNTSPSLNALSTDPKNGRQMAGSAHMSATALLQKAAQIGATASNSMSPPNPMMPRSFVTGMAGPEQIPTMRSYAGGHHHGSYDPIQPQAEQQSQMIGIDGDGGVGAYSSQFMQKNPHDLAPQFFEASANDNPGVNEISMFNQPTGFFMGSEQNHGFMKNSMEHENSISSSNLLQGRSTSSTRTGMGMGMGIPISGRTSKFGSSGNGGDMMTLDFLGVGPTRSMSFHEQQQQQQQGMEFEVVNQQRLRSMHHRFPAGVEKPAWDV
ncbi:zinc finger protein GAI-ASSOCIATED FACTOR 1-like [Aristolochia californica]|uniref:zinc finger protein GAI-ASSOCIATED FACTOR 1-like n=1 Tax=Aristolochia californica TaxID=171875 RepID=UPI0035DCA5A1